RMRKAGGPAAKRLALLTRGELLDGVGVREPDELVRTLLAVRRHVGHEVIDVQRAADYGAGRAARRDRDVDRCRLAWVDDDRRERSRRVDGRRLEVTGG